MVDGRVFPDAQAQEVLKASDRISWRALPVLIIVDRDFRIALTSQASEIETVGPDFVDVEGRRLGPSIDTVVRDLVASWTDPDQVESNCFAVVPPTYVIRVIPLHGDAQRFVAITIEQCRDRDSLTPAARTYSLSPRETEVLSLILEGAQASEIADRLSLAESTVQGYFKRLLSKTRSRNRPSMVAKVLGWDGFSVPALDRSPCHWREPPFPRDWRSVHSRSLSNAR
jgi:DNA-binding CsgD family transcriptional regulator